LIRNQAISAVKTSKAIVLVAALVTLAPITAAAQQRPLVTEDPETIGAGRLLFEAGFDYGRGVEYPVSGLTGQLLRVPLIGVSVGISSIAELQFDGGFYNRLAITGRDLTAPLADLVTAAGDTTSSVEDLVVATKVRILGETPGRPAFGLRLATKLPNASNESGIGTDTTDFTASLLVGKTVRSVRTVANGGFGVLGDPVVGNRQADVITYGVSLARALTQAAEVVGEINGRFDTREDEPDRPSNTRSAVRLGARYTVGGWRGDAAVIFGLTSRDPGIGFAAGFTYVFQAFQIP
jgi:hypothetical protein